MNCEYCKKKFISKNKKYFHIREFHTFTNTQKKQCSLCNKEFNSCKKSIKNNTWISKCEKCREKSDGNNNNLSNNSIIKKDNKKYKVIKGIFIEICKIDKCKSDIHKNSKCYFHYNFKKFIKISNTNYYISKDGEIFNSFGKKIVKTISNKYYTITLQINKKSKMFYLHRLLAQTYIKNPKKYKIVNHKDGNKLNYKLQNLEWCSHKQNSQHAHDNLLNKISKAVNQLNENNEIVNTFQSIKQASLNTNYSSKYISKCCNNTIKDNIFQFVLKTDIKKNKKIKINEKIEYKPIPNYQNYEISKNGLVKNKISNNNLIGYEREYVSVSLINNNKSKKELVHRLVALCYLPNPNKYKLVNHKDGNKINNNVDNLEWCNNSQNVLHALDTGLNKSRKIIYQIDKDNNIITTFNSMKEAADKLKLTASNISRVCNGVYKHTKGLMFKFKEENKQEKEVIVI